MDAAGNGIGIRRNGTWDTDMPNAKIFGVRLRQGDAYLMQSGGGGGFGSPLEREPERVAFDVREGYISAEAAQRDYGVVVTAEGMLDAEASAKLRAQMRESGASGEEIKATAG
jgi:N-methylhydantoinase B